MDQSEFTGLNKIYFSLPPLVPIDVQQREAHEEVSISHG